MFYDTRVTPHLCSSLASQGVLVSVMLPARISSPITTRAARGGEASVPPSAAAAAAETVVLLRCCRVLHSGSADTAWGAGKERGKVWHASPGGLPGAPCVAQIDLAVLYCP